MNNILITGTSGFIGSNFLEFIKSKFPNATVHTLDKNGSSNPTYHGDYFSIDLNQRYDVCFHFAAESSVDYSFKYPIETYGNNVMRFLAFMERNVGRFDNFVYISTDEVYGDKQRGYENSPMMPTNPYASSKAAAEMVIHELAHRTKCNYLITRCGNNYGKNQSGKLIPTIFKCLKNDEVFFLDGNGGQTRNWVNVIDHCEGILHFYELFKNVKLKTINIATTDVFSVNEVIEFAQKITGKTLKIERVNRRPYNDRCYDICPKRANRAGFFAKRKFQDYFKELFLNYYEKEIDRAF